MLRSFAHIVLTGLVNESLHVLGSGNVLKIQNLLHILSEKYEEKVDKVDKAKAAAAEKGKPKDHHHHKKDSRRSGSSGGSTAPGAPRRSRRHAASTSSSTEEAMQVDEPAAAGATEEGAASASGFDYHAHQGLAVLGIAIIAMGEEVGQEMAFRMFGHLVSVVLNLPLRHI